MLTTILKGTRKAATQPRRPVPAVRGPVIDISGPLPAAAPAPAKVALEPEVEAHPYQESALVAASLRPTTWRRDETEMSHLPREIDPFESDFPWIGWVEPRHESFIRSELRSPTFERDMQRVLAIFAN